MALASDHCLHFEVEGDEKMVYWLAARFVSPRLSWA